MHRVFSILRRIPVRYFGSKACFTDMSKIRPCFHLLPQVTTLDLVSSSTTTNHDGRKEVIDFLQTLVTHDLYQLSSSSSSSSSCLYTGWLNGKGRMICDSWISTPSDLPLGARIAVPVHLSSVLQKHIHKYKMRKKLVIHDRSVDTRVYGIFPSASTGYSELQDLCEELSSRNKGHLGCMIDPRSEKLGIRLTLPTSVDPPNVPPSFSSNESCDVYHALRVLLGIGECLPQPYGELQPEKTLPYHYNLDLLHGASMEKGCYLGQELTVRTFHQGTIRKRLIPCVLTALQPSSSFSSSGNDGAASLGMDTGSQGCVFSSEQVSMLQRDDAYLSEIDLNGFVIESEAEGQEKDGENGAPQAPTRRGATRRSRKAGIIHSTLRGTNAVIATLKLNPEYFSSSRSSSSSKLVVVHPETGQHIARVHPFLPPHMPHTVLLQDASPYRQLTVYQESLKQKEKTNQKG